MPRFFIHAEFNRYGKIVWPAKDMTVRCPSGNSYFFGPGRLVAALSDADADYLSHMGSPDEGLYMLREVDANFRPVGVFPPVDSSRRRAMVNPRTYPTDESPEAKEYIHATETMGDKVIFYHYSRVRLRGPKRSRPNWWISG